MKILIKIMILTGIINFLFAADKSDVLWLERKAEGWAWYEREEKDKEKEEEIKPKEEEIVVIQEILPAKEDVQLPKTEKEKLEELKKTMEETLAKAILNPTIENIESYMRMQFVMMQRSSVFADTWRKALLIYPELDNTVLNPVSQYGLTVAKKIAKEKKDSLLKDLGQKYMLFFFYESTCEFAKSYSKVLIDFCNRHGWKILGISFNDQYLPEIPSLPKTNKLTKHFHIKYSPAVMLFDPKTEEIIPIGWGILTLSQLEDNIIQNFEKKELINENK